MTKYLYAAWAAMTVGLAFAVMVLYKQAVEANARADTMRAVWEAHAATDSAYKDSVVAFIAVQDDSITMLLAQKDSSVARADSIAAASDTTARTVERLLEGNAAAGRAFASYRAQRDSLDVELRHAIATCEHVIALLQRKDEARSGLLDRTQLRLTEALAGWEASERARRSDSWTDWIIRGLAVVGTYKIGETIVKAAF